MPLSLVCEIYVISLFEEVLAFLDYQGFAAERPEELAEAIAKGVPATLRGMMWQHMLVAKFLTGDAECSDKIGIQGSIKRP